MALSRHIQLIEDIVVFMRAQTYPTTFEIERVNVVERDLSDTQSTVVFVTPGSRSVGSDPEAATRGDLLKNYEARVHILNFLEGGQTEEDDSLLLVEAIEDSLIYRDMGEMYFTSFSSDANPEPPFDVQLKQDADMFYSRMNLEYIGR